MGQKTVWFIFKEASPANQGAYSRHFFLARQLVKKGYKVYIFASTFHHFQFEPKKQIESYSIEEIDGVNVCWLKGVKYKNPHGLKRVLSWFVYSWRLLLFPVKKIGPPSTIVISSPPLIPILNAFLFKKRFKNIKIILEIRDIWPKTFIDVGNYSKYNPMIVLMSWIEKLGYKISDHIVATIPKADEHIKKVINKPFDYRCIPQGIDSNFIQDLEELDDDFKNNNIPKDRFIIGYAGTIGASNALETLVEAARKLSLIKPEITILLLGDGFFKDRLVEQSKGLDNITFLPRIKKTKVISFLRECDVLYDSVKMVPLYKYGLSRNKWIEYMYSAKPIIASYSGYLSLINEAECGVAVPAEDVDALVDQILDYYEMEHEQRTKIGLKGKDYILKNRTYEQLTEQLTEIL